MDSKHQNIFEILAKHAGYPHYGYTTEPPHIKCSYKPTKNCTEMTEEICEPIEKNTEEEICIEVPSQKANKVSSRKYMQWSGSLANLNIRNENILISHISINLFCS